MYSSDIFNIRAWIFTGTGHIATGKADFWAFEFCPSFGGFRAVPAHGMAFPAYRDTVIIDGKGILVYRWTSPVGIEINEWNALMFTAVFIITLKSDYKYSKR